MASGEASQRERRAAPQARQAAGEGGEGGLQPHEQDGAGRGRGHAPPHRLYHRQVKRTNKFAAHDEKNEAKIGDRVLLESTRPLSKTKRWRVREILKRAEVIEP